MKIVDLSQLNQSQREGIAFVCWRENRPAEARNEAIATENAAIESANAALPAGQTPTPLKPLEPTLTPQEYIDSLIRRMADSYAKELDDEKFERAVVPAVFALPIETREALMNQIGVGDYLPEKYQQAIT